MENTTCQHCGRPLTLPSEIGAHECLACVDMIADIRMDEAAERWAEAEARWEAA